MLSLPTEVIVYILRFLDVKDLCNVSLVCTHLRDISETGNLWKEHLLAKFGDTFCDQQYGKWSMKRMFMWKSIGQQCLRREIHVAVKIASSKYNAKQLRILSQHKIKEEVGKVLFAGPKVLNCRPLASPTNRTQCLYYVEIETPFGSFEELYHSSGNFY